MSNDERLHQLADRQEITEQLYRYCRAVDRLDPQLGYSVWHEDGTADYGEDYYQGTGRGVIDKICADHLHGLIQTHQVTNVLIELDGDRAASESYVVSAFRTTADGQLKQITTWARYIDQWSRRAGRWAIDRRFVIRDIDEVSGTVPLSPAWRGRRDRSDPSYAVLEGLKR